MSARFVKWHRSSSGSAFSKDGRFAIKPATGEPKRPIFLLIDLREVGARRPKGHFATHAKAKLEAEEIAKREECERIVRFAEDLARERLERE